MRKNLALWVCFVLVFNILGSSLAKALDVTATPASEFAASAPLMITGYQTAIGATDILAIEVYNNGSTLIDINNWSLSTITKDASEHAATFKTSHSGLLLPGEHVVLSTSEKTTYKLQYTPAGISTVLTLSYNKTDTAYRVATTPVKDSSDVPFFRTYTTTGYSTAAQPFAAAPVRVFYDDGLYMAPGAPIGLKIVEFYPYSSDCAPNDTAALCSDYIKLQNVSEQSIDLDGYVLRTDSYGSSRTTSNTVKLSGEVPAHGTMAIAKTNSGDKLQLTNSGGYAWIEDTWGLMRYDETVQRYLSAGTAQQGLSYALNAQGEWQWTTTPAPNGANTITLPVSVVTDCPEGKYRNPDTGRCRTVEEAVNALSGCDEGYERNPVTNRCRKLASLTASSLTPCGEGQERNPATNRCRSIATAVAELLPCDEGYERNPSTNRCRKMQSDTVPQAAFPVTPVAKAATDMTGWLAFGGVAAVAIGYGIWEWRSEIANGSRRLFGVLRRTR